MVFSLLNLLLFFVNVMTHFFLCIVLMVLCGIHALYAQVCDTDKQCIGNALTLRGTITDIQFAQVERITGGRVERSTVLDSLRQAMTFETYFSAIRQANKRQFIAGSWGINTDQNDMWRLYIEDTGSATSAEIVFEVDDPTQQTGLADNAIIRVRVPNMYDTWHHCAVTFDGVNRRISMLLNGQVVTTASIPFSTLLLADDRVPLQFGCIAGINADRTVNAPFNGQLDEIRVWNRVLSSADIACGYANSFEGFEQGLIAYYRCNGSDTQRQLCDATNNNRSSPLIGATLTPSNRTTEPRAMADPASFAQTIVCDTATSTAITIRNTTSCPQRYYVALYGDTTYYRVMAPFLLVLDAMSSTTITVRFAANLTGQFIGVLFLRHENRCGDELHIPIRITRTTNLAVSDNALLFPSLLGGCVDTRSQERTLTLTNTSTTPITVSNMSLSGQGLQVFFLQNTTLPFALAPGEQRGVRIVFMPPLDSSRTFNDTLSITSSDCRFVQRIPLSATQVEIFRVGSAIVNNPRFTQPIVFADECVGQVGSPFGYIMVNFVTDGTFHIDTIIVPRGFVGRRQSYPVLIQPALVNADQFIRFQPVETGVTEGTVIVRGRMNGSGCVFEQRFTVRGRGVESRPEILLPFNDYGSVLIGRDSTVLVTLRNSTPRDTLRISVSLRNGAHFVRTGGQAFTLLPGSSATTTIAFRPVTTGTLSDQICIFEQRCFASTCVSISGIGVNEVISIEPTTLRIENAVSCGQKDGELLLRNITNQPQTLTNVNFTAVGRFVISPAIPTNRTITLSPNSVQRWTCTYLPNDNTTDRSDRGTLTFTLAGQNWITQVLGTSLVPRIGTTRLVTFGMWEVGDRARDTVYIENVTPYPVSVGAPILNSTGFQIVQALDGNLPKELQPRERMRFVVEFAPQQARSFRDTIFFSIPAPCTSPTARIVLTGQGIIERTEIPLSFLNFGFVYPCECVTREVVMVNNSFVHEHTIESIMTDGNGITPVETAQPQLFTWKRKRTNASVVPFTIAKQERDTIQITYCPRTPSTQEYSVNSANMRFRARGPGWSQTYTVYIAGRRSLAFVPTPDSLVFPPMIAGTTSATQTARLTIPGFDLNPRLENVEIDSIAVISSDPPDAVNIFRIAPPHTNLALLPNTVRSLGVTFHPVEAREYKARLALYLKKPCNEIDTTIALSGTAYPSANSLQARFDANRFGGTTTVSANPCDTIRVPMFLTRTLPRDLSEFSMRLQFDSTHLQLIGVRSIQPQAGTAVFLRSMSGTSIIFRNTQAGNDVTIPFGEILFTVRAGFRGLTSLRTDSLRPFLDGLDPASAFGRIRITNPQLSARSTLRYDSVLVGECATDTLRLTNDGNTDIRLDPTTAHMLFPRSVRIIRAIPPLGTIIPPGTATDVIVQYCPQRAEVTSSTFRFAVLPCSVSTTVSIVAQSYATPFTLGIMTQQVQSTLATPTLFAGYLSDTVKIAILPDRAMQAVVRGQQFIQRQVNFSGIIEYSPYALKYIATTTAQSSVASMHSVQAILERHGRVRIQVSSLATVLPEALAILTFTVPLPDTTISAIRSFIVPATFVSDTIQYFDVQALPTTATFQTLGRCGIESIRFPDDRISTNGLVSLQSFPQPAVEDVMMNVVCSRDVTADISLYSLQGQTVQRMISGKLLQQGTHTIPITIHHHPPGTYFLVVRTEFGQYVHPIKIIR